MVETKRMAGYVPSLCSLVFGFVFLVITFFSTRERIDRLPVKDRYASGYKGCVWKRSLAGYVHTYAFHFITLAMWGSAMNYYFENYVDAGALYAFLDRLGLVAMETDGSAGYAVLNASGW